jgi:hypothetical protein
MNFRVHTRNEEMCLVIKVTVTMPTKVRVKIFDEDKPKNVFTDRYKTVKGEETFYVRMPVTPKGNIIISVYDEAKGNLPKAQEKNIKVEINKMPLEKRMDVVDIVNPSVAYFVDFAQRFCFNSGYLDTNKYYQSDNREFTIKYVPTIISSKDGRELTTPARINRMTGCIEVSKKQFDDFTFPMKFAILCHEFSHFYVNENQDDESEADLNGLLIYLGLGYPRIEAYQAFLDVFEGAPSQANKNRFDVIDKFIKNFEKNKIVFKN